ncbi:KilA-N domain-containing protein [Chromohalobacter sp. 48-RD10]|uniref:KilA-N domain-containing protein n=1 Tax=Chromohalobacter sp. 48-RD10 TaxID=2994063 RepID=UPI00246978E0|nr:KilA-N domain-containing protein [Chromohalobacter sp. 48-RD10]
MSALMAIEGVKVRQDEEGRYCLNDLQKAATVGRNPRTVEVHEYMRRPETGELIAELENTGNSRIKPVTTRRGRNGGTFVAKELVYAYAMWISPAFHLRVIRTFDALVQGEVEMARGVAMREQARLESRFLTDAVKYSRLDQGKVVKHYHFSNEYDLVNRIVLGCSSKQYRERHGIPSGQPVRDHLTPGEIETIAHLQNVDTGLIEAGLTFEQRKQRLSRIYMRRHASRLCAEVQRLEA